MANIEGIKEHSKDLIKPLINRMKYWINSLTLEVFRSTSQRVLDQKMNSFNNKNLFANEDMAEHFAHILMEEIASQNVVKGFIIDRVQFIEQVLARDQIKQDTFIDIGDPDGIFIKALGKDGLSANISEIGVKNIYKKGIAAIRCDAEHLPFKDNSIDHVLFFQIFEHLSNPIDGLKELRRVAAKSVILSIPYVSKTNIHRYNYCPEWPIFEHHIFELDSQDFQKIVSHAHLAIRHHAIIEVLKPVTFKERFIFLFWDLMSYVWKEPEYQDIGGDLFASCFKRFSVFYLIKKNRIA